MVLDFAKDAVIDMHEQDIRDQLELAKKAMQKALGHLARLEQLTK